MARPARATRVSRQPRSRLNIEHEGPPVRNVAALERTDSGIWATAEGCAFLVGKLQLRRSRRKDVVDLGDFSSLPARARRAMVSRTATRMVLLLRHGKSSWADPALPDADRPLTARGERASRRIAKYLRRKGIRPALVLCSPSRLTRQTLAAIEPSLGPRCRVEFVPELYGASSAEVLERLRVLPESVRSVLVIAHNPGLQNLALSLACRGAGLAQVEAKFPTGALATIACRCEHWSDLGPGEAELVDYVVPRQLE